MALEALVLAALAAARSDGLDAAKHAAGVLAERRAALVEAWLDAPDEGRRAARRPFLDRRSYGAAAVLSAPERALAMATRYARGEAVDGAPYPGLLAVADALDLRLVPGALEAGESRAAEVHIAWVQIPEHAEVPDDVSLRLAVVTADRKVLPLAAFRFAPRKLGLDGAVLPVELPALPAGSHWLAAELEHERHVVPSFFVPFEVVEGLAAELERAALADDSALAHFVRFGARYEGRGTLAARLSESPDAPASSVARSAEPEPPPDAPASGAGAPSSDAVSASWVGPQVGAPCRAILFVDVPPPADPATWLAGAEGETWRALGLRGIRVVAFRVEPYGDARSMRSLAVVATLARADPATPRVLAIGIDRFGALATSVDFGAGAFQGIALHALHTPGAAPPLPAELTAEGETCRVLVLESLAPADLDPSAEDSGTFPRIARVRRFAPPPVAALELAAWVERGLVPHLPAPAPLPEAAEAEAEDEASGEGDGGDRSAAEIPADMRLVPASEPTIDGERRTVRAFLADAREVTNADFAKFVAATGYVTDAERIGNAVCFVYDAAERGRDVFEVVDGADWRRPGGPGTTIEDRMDHPVVQVSWNDAVAYAAWAKKRLPSRDEWFAMARAAGSDAPYPFGDRLVRDGVHAANVWQGPFPLRDEGSDGHRGTAPAGSYPAGAHGLHDVGGNVWEWTAELSRGVPAGVAPGELAPETLAVARGGSFLCRERAVPPYAACRGYLVGASEAKPLHDANDHVGFRCVRDVE